MKKIKKLLSLVIAMAMAIVTMLSTGIMVSATENNNTITIKATDAGRKYQAYQIFKGTYSDSDKFLINIEWGDAVDSAKLIGLLKKNEKLKEYFSSLTTDSDAKTVASLLENDAFSATNDPKEELRSELASMIGESIKDDAVPYSSTEPSAKGTDNYYPYTISGLPDGYYIVNEDNSVMNGEKKVEQDTYTRWMLKVVSDATIFSKESNRPSLDKVINKVYKSTSDTTGTDPANSEATSVAIGDYVEFKLGVDVPNMTGYQHYQYVIHDTVSTGLTLDATSVKIYVGDSTDEYSADKYTATVNGQNMKIVFKNFLKEFSAKSGEKIWIYYKALVNKNAFETSTKEDNKAYLQYSNDPTSTHAGDPSNPNNPGDPDDPDDDPNSVTGKTPEKKVYVYSAQVQIKKVGDNGLSLKGAGFTLTAKEGANIITSVRTEKTVEFKENTEGTFYKLADGSYTEVEPTSKTSSYYVAPVDGSYTKYVRTVSEKQILVKNDSNAIVGTVDDSGYLTFTGLAAGTYVLKETTVPEGYQAISDAEFTIEFHPDTADAGAGYFTATKSANSTSQFVINKVENSTYAFAAVVKNVKGSVLPETGGIGTTIFYVFGAILVFAAGILLVTRRRMNAER
jgi:LPXTG-motif cell wall-anchored protein